MREITKLLSRFDVLKLLSQFTPDRLRVDSGVSTIGEDSVCRLENILREDPKRTRILKNLALIYINQALEMKKRQSLDRAEMLLQKAMEEGIFDPELKAYYSSLLFLKVLFNPLSPASISKVHKGIKLLNEAVEEEPKNYIIRSIRGIAFAQLPDKIFRLNRIALDDLMYVFNHLGGNVNEPSDPKAFADTCLSLGSLLMKLKRFQEAKDVLSRIFPIAPDSYESRQAEGLLQEMGIPFRRNGKKSSKQPKVQRDSFPVTEVESWEQALGLILLYIHQAVRGDAAAIGCALGTLENFAARSEEHRSEVHAIREVLHVIEAKFEWYPIVRITKLNLGLHELDQVSEKTPGNVTISFLRGIIFVNLPDELFHLRADGIAELEKVVQSLRGAERPIEQGLYLGACWLLRHFYSEMGDQERSSHMLKEVEGVKGPFGAFEDLQSLFSM